MKVAAYQAPVLPVGAIGALELIRLQVAQCALWGVEVLCCPEAILGGLADDSADPHSLALTRQQLAEHVVPVAHPEVTLIVGFTEAGGDGYLYNAAAVIQHRELIGIYRKQHPAIRRSVYSAGNTLPVFTIGADVFGIVICYDSTFPELARGLADQGASLLFIPTNTALPLLRNSGQVVADARQCDVERAMENDMVVVRADVAGVTVQLSTPGSTAITDRDGTVLGVAEPFRPGLVVAEIDLSGRHAVDAQSTISHRGTP